MLEDLTLQPIFAQLFQNPTIKGMMDLTPVQFEKFIIFVFQYAGFDVEYVGNLHFPHGPGVDLNLRYFGQSQVQYRVEIRRYNPGNMLVFNDVVAFLGILHIAGNVPGILVTTSEFNGPAKAAATAAQENIQLVNGQLLLRYIDYVRGSKVKDSFLSPKTSSEPISPSLLPIADGINRLKKSTTKVISIANNRGGVAKTTSAINIGFALAAQGKNVLLIDMDGQCSLSRTLPNPEIPRETKFDEPSIRDYVLKGTSIRTLVRPRFKR